MFKKIKLNPNIGNLRTSLEGAGIIQLQHGRVENGRVSRQIKNKLAQTKIGSAPILEGAVEQINKGQPLWYCGKEITKKDLSFGA